MSQGQSVNTFTELNTDSAAVNTKPSVMTDAINATLTTKGENQLILQNMNGNEQVTVLTPGFQPLGVKVFKGISYIVSGKFDVNGKFQEGEIGSFPSPDWDNLMSSGLNSDYYLPLKNEYAPLKNFSTQTGSVLDNDDNYKQPFRTDKLDFDASRLIEVEIQPSYDDSVNIIFTDDRNPIRLVNSRFKLNDDGKKAAVADRRQQKDTNTYAESRFGATKLIRQSDQMVDLVYNGLSYGGSVKGGGYRFYFKYIDSDGALTDIIEESRLVSMGYDDHGATDLENTGKTISFTLNNLDQKFSGIKVYYSYATGTTDVTTSIKEVKDIYDLPASGTSMDIVIYGTENIEEISYATLNLDYSSIDTVKTIAQHDDRLVLGNITNTTENYDTLRLSAERLKIEEDTTDLHIKDLGKGYADPHNVYYNLGYWSGETYEIGIVYVLNKGRGLTPVFPVRGGDNYSTPQTGSGITGFPYTGTTPITTVDGYVTGSSENRLGVYRTHKRKVTLKGANYDTTEVRKLKINVQSLLTDTLVQSETDGFFFVRRERKKDALAQGYICNTCSIPVKNDLSATWPAQQDARVGIGKDRYATVNPYTDPLKVMPSPGRIWENTILTTNNNRIDINNVTRPAVGDPLSMQGIVFPDPVITTRNDDNIPMNYSFYSPDQLVNQALMSSLFSGSNKGLNVNGPLGDIVIAHQDVVDHDFSANATGASGYPISYVMSFPIPANQVQNIHDCANGNATCGTDLGAFNLELPFSTIEASPNANLQLNLVGNLTSKDGRWQPGTTTQYKTPAFQNVGQPVTFDSFINIGLTVDTAGNMVAGTGRVKGSAFDSSFANSTATSLHWAASHQYLHIYDQTIPQSNSNWTNGNVQFGEVISANFDSINTIGTGNLGNFTIRIKLPIYVNNHSIQSNTPGQLLYTEEVQITGQYYMDTVQPSLNSNQFSVSDTGRTPIQNIRIDNYTFDPVPIVTGTGDSITATYVPEGQDSFSDGQFAAKSDRNLFYRVRAGKDNQGIDFPWPGLMPTGANSNSQESLLFAADQLKFSDYIGIRMSKGDTLLTQPLRNDDLNVRNFRAHQGNGYGYAGDDLSDWTYKVHDEGFRFGVVGNIYDSPAGAQSQADWKNKYSNTSYVNPYYAITKRYSWSDIQALTDKNIDILDGDCFINYTYKRLNYALGIEGSPQATDPTLYGLLLRPGLYKKGTVFPIVCEGNYNTALRTYQFKDGTEKALYGKNRTFYPVDTIEHLRGSRQPESNGYNHGYHYAFSDRNYVALNDRAPVLDIQYGNRVMVSESSIAGNFANGYTDFSGLNFRDYNKQLGEITKLVAHNNNLFCIFEKGIGVVPMNQRTMMGGEQNGIFIDDAQILAQKMRVISTEYGSDQQFGIIKTDEYVYGCDLNKTKVWRIVSQGEQHSIELISDFAVQVILNEYKNRLDTNQLHNVVKANYDRERNNVIFSFLSEFNGTYSTDLYEVTKSTKDCPCPDPSKIQYVADNTNSYFTSTDNNKPLTEECCELIQGHWEQRNGETVYRCYETTKKENCPTDIVAYPGPPAYYESTSQAITEECCSSIPGSWWGQQGADKSPKCYTSAPTKTGGGGTNDQLGTARIQQEKDKTEVQKVVDKSYPVAENAYSLNKYTKIGDSNVTGGLGASISNIPPCTIGDPVVNLLEKDKLGSLYFNETISKWVSRLSWNPLFTFNISNNLYSFNATNQMDKVWEHFSDNVPYCHFYGSQDKFEFEFILVDNSSAQKILNNMHFVCNRSFPGRITYKIDKDVDYETFGVSDSSYTDLMRQRHELVNWTAANITQTIISGNLHFDLGISKEEAERIVGSHFVFNNNFYIIGNAVTLNNINYVTIQDQTGNPLSGSLTGLFINRLEFGIIQQNMEYREDHLYVEVGKGTNKSRVRDKAIKVRIVYEGQDYTTIQSIISKFVYSFN